MVHRWAPVIGPRSLSSGRPAGEAPRPETRLAGAASRGGRVRGCIARRRARMAERVAGIHHQGATLPETVAVIRRADPAGGVSGWLAPARPGARSPTPLA